jgi:hypothetical protein
MSVMEPVLDSAAQESNAPELLKARYIKCLARAGEEGAGLRQAIHALVKWGVGRRQLVQWAAEAGYSTGYVRSLISSILKDLGHRSRKPGAGRKVAHQAIALRVLGQKHYGKQARKFLLAAYRANETQRASIVPLRFRLSSDSEHFHSSGIMSFANKLSATTRTEGVPIV